MFTIILTASKLLMALLSVALVFTMMPLSMGFSYAEEGDQTAAVLSVTGDDLVTPLSYDSIKTLKNDESIKPLILEGVTFRTLNSSDTEEEFTVTGVTIESLIKLAGLKEGMELDSVTATANDGYSKTYTADQILKEDLQGNKAMFIWSENGEKVQKTAVGQFDPTEQNRKLWVGGDSIKLTVKAKAEAPAPAVLTVKGDDLVSPLSYDSIKILKNDESIKPLILQGVSFHTLNSSGTEEDFTVTGVTIESLVNLAGIKEGMELDSVTATANDGYSKTYTADQILKEDLQGNKAMFIWDENGEKVQKTVVGQFAKDEQNKKLWVKGDTIELTVNAKVKEEVTPVPAKVTPPGRVTFKSLKAGKKKAYLKWGKVKNAKGYIIYRATKKNGKYKAVKTIKKGSTVKWTNTKLKKGKTYYYKIKAYKLNNGKKVLSKKFSVVKKVKIKK